MRKNFFILQLFCFEEAKKLEFERRRKEMEDARREKRKNHDGTPRKRKKKKEMLEQEKQETLQAAQGQSQFLGPFDPQNLDQGPRTLPPALMSPEKEKKKRRKGKKEKAAAEGAENFDIIMENFNQQLKQLPPVLLMEPDVGHTYTICSLAGASAEVNGESCFCVTYYKVMGLISLLIVWPSKTCLDYY